MPKWIHDRADHIRADNPGMKKSTSFAIATQQAYATGKAPKKDFGTPEGKREAHQKYDEPKSEYKQTADPSHKSKTSTIHLVSLLGFADELQKIAQTTTAPTSVGDVRKALSAEGTSLTKRKPSYSKTRKEPLPITSPSELAESSKSIQPPPVTMPA